jgi:hypothetical protein
LLGTAKTPKKRISVKTEPWLSTVPGLPVGSIEVFPKIPCPWIRVGLWYRWLVLGSVSGMTGSWASWQKVAAGLAHAVRLAALVSCVAAAIWFGPAEIIRFVIVFVGLLLPRWAKAPAGFDFAFGLTVLVAAWSGVLGWYEAIRWWDVAVHFLTTGAVGAMAYFCLSRTSIVPRIRESTVPRRTSRLVLLPLALGAAAAAWWELWEWFGHNFLSEDIHVGYDDTVLDLAAGTAGSLLAGGMMALWAARHDKQAVGMQEGVPGSLT